MIENYPNPRRMHCESGVMVNLLEYYGYKISEPMVFGIGGGIYFLYFPWLKVLDFTLVVMRTKPTEVIRHFTQRMNIGYHEQSFGSDSFKAEKALDGLLAKNVPTGLVVNILGLKYLNDIGFDLDYNGHHIVVLGKEGSKYIIADIDEKLPNDDLVTLDESYMRQVRFRSGISAPHGRMFYIDPLPSDFADHVDLKQAIIKGLDEACRNMTSIPFMFFGIKGMHYFAKNLRKWERKFSQEHIDYSLLWYYRILEQAGTGGAGYRYMYADFLKEAAGFFNSQVLGDCAANYVAAADTWRKFSVGCNRYINRKNITMNELADIVDEAAYLEFETFKKIKKNFLTSF